MLLCLNEAHVSLTPHGPKTYANETKDAAAKAEPVKVV
jgi:hypothetical protein